MVESYSAAAVKYDSITVTAGKTEAPVQTVHFTVLPVQRNKLMLQATMSQPVKHTAW